ncbi:MAG: enoyl-CoA hydratase/isomerase family protein [Solirubrobacterales bacterium]
MSEDSVVYEKSGSRATIWLNRPGARNSMTEGMSGGFRTAIIEASRDPEVRVIVYRGKGEDFCAGSALDDLPLDDLDGVLTAFDPVSRNGYPAIFKGHRPIDNDQIPKMTVAVVHGYAVGGGFEIACDADFVIAAEDAKIGDLHVARGIVGGAGVLANVARMVGMRRAKDLVFGGRLLSGAEAEEWGIANRAVPRDQLDAAVDRLVDHLAGISPRLTRLAKIAYGRSLEADKETLAALETMLLLNLLGDRDADEGINSFLEHRDPVWAESRGEAGGAER